jgi:hypothetical protein
MHLQKTFIIAAIAIISCTSSVEDFTADANCTGITPTYNAQASVIINNSCAFSGCHNNATKKEGISLEGYTNAKSQFLDNSKNLASIHHASGVEKMPYKGTKLDDATINLLDCWVKNGCPE